MIPMKTIPTEQKSLTDGKNNRMLFYAFDPKITAQQLVKAKKTIKNAKKHQKVWWFQKNVVPLHPLLSMAG